MKTILSIDGGGIKGIIPASLIAYIEKQTGKPAASLFDIIAGTSTGGMITSMLTVPGSNGKPKYSAELIKDLYRQFGDTVFKESRIRKISTLNGIAGPRYTLAPLEKLLKEYLGDSKLNSALTRIIVTAYNTKTSTPWFFKSAFAAKHDNKADNPFLWEVVLATSSVPAYFSPVGIGGNCFIDGGVFASNPTLCAYAEAKKNYPDENLLFVSLGTGENNESLPCDKIKKWGAAKWLIPVLNILINSSSATVDYQMKALSEPGNYYRYQVNLESPHSEMDNTDKENLEFLESIAQKIIKDNKRQLDTLCNRLVLKK